LNQNHHEPLSNYAFNVKLRRYNKEVSTLLIFLVVIGVSLYFITSSDSVGRYSLTVSKLVLLKAPGRN